MHAVWLRASGLGLPGQVLQWNIPAPIPLLPLGRYGSFKSESRLKRHGSAKREPDFNRRWRRRESNPRKISTVVGFAF
jgi:hypothetical protein